MAPESPLDIAWSIACPLWRGLEDDLERALYAAARAEAAHGAVSILLTDDAEIAALNRAWRAKEGPTNVLSFPAPAPNPHHFLGDIALAAETIAAEAEGQGKSMRAHAAHLAVHGFLHLLGYDHGAEDEAERMETRERTILADIGIADPYRERI